MFRCEGRTVELGLEVEQGAEKRVYMVLLCQGDTSLNGDPSP